MWVAVWFVGGEAIDGAVAERSSTTGSILRWGGLIGWSAGVACLAVLSVVTLTAVRVLLPLSIPLAVLASVGGADPAWGAAFVAVAVVTSALVLSADVGRPFVQASAYGSEDRHLLRPPPAYLLAATLAWAILAAGVTVGAALLAAERWVVASILLVGAASVAAWSWPRWHRLSRRWFVVVPVGLVIHDHLVLAETVMLRRQEIAALHLAPSGSEAADLSGLAPGHAIEIVTTESVTAIYAGTPQKPGGTAIHLNACLVTPTRPGQVLRSAAAHRLPVG
jgi:hypothetical protein